MKKGLLIGFIGLVISISCYSQTTWDGGGGNTLWTTANNWNPNGVPGAAADILFNNGGTITISQIPTSTTIGKIRVTNNTTVILIGNTAGNTTLTASTAAVDAIDVDAGSTLQLRGIRQGANEFSLTLSTANTVGLQANIDGTLRVTTEAVNRPGTIGVFTKGGANAVINFNSGSTYVHDVDGSLIPTANWSPTSTCNVTGITSTAPSALTQAFGNFTWDCVNHAFTINLNSLLTTINGDFTVKNAGSTAGGSGKANVPLVLSANSNLTLNITGNFNVEQSSTGATWISMSIGTANVTVNVSGNFNMSKNGGGVCYFDFKVDPTSTMGTHIINVNGNFNLSGGYFDWTYQTNGGSNQTVMNLYGNFSHTGASTIMITSTGTTTIPNGKINFVKSGAQTFYSATPANLAYTNFEVMSGSSVEMLSSLYLTSSTNAPWGGQFLVNTGAILDANTFQIVSSTGTTVGSNNSFTLNSGAGIITANINGLHQIGFVGPTISAAIATRTFSSGANYTYDGTALQVSGTFVTTPVANQVNNLTINNTAGINTTGVTLQQEFKVASTCTFVSGVFTTTNTNILTINDNATIIGTDLDAGSSKYVNGPLKKIGNDFFAFPVGKQSHGCRPIFISAPSSTTDEFRAELIRGDAGALGPITASGLQKVSGCEYWYLDRLAGTSGVDVSLSWSGESPCNSQSYVTDLPNLVVAHFNGTSWDAYGNDGGVAGNAVKGTVTWNNVSTFSPFSLGSLLWWTNPLTVKFINLQAAEINGKVKVDWANIAETGVEKYFVEHSIDGRSFTEISNTTAKMNNGNRADYSWKHLTPVTGFNFYRIKAVEYSGEITYSHVVRISLGKTNNEFIVYPNPVEDNNVTIAASGLTAGKYDIIVLNMSGQQIMHRSLNHAGGSISMQVNLPESIKAGLYSIKLAGKEKTFVKTFLVQ